VYVPAELFHTSCSKKLELFLEQVISDELVLDGVLSQNHTQSEQLWALREGVAESMQRSGYVYKYDLSLPLSRMYELVQDTRERIGDLGYVVGYGHLGDCTL
jgi:FAD/FMN-containing dehydrogenase